MSENVWEYTPGRDWWYRYPDDDPVTRDVPPVRQKMPMRWMDAAVLVLLGCVVLWFAHQFRTQRVHAAAAMPAPKFAVYHNCKLLLPGVQPEQSDGDPTHTLFHPYNYTVCDGVGVTLWSETR